MCIEKINGENKKEKEKEIKYKQPNQGPRGDQPNHWREEKSFHFGENNLLEYKLSFFHQVLLISTLISIETCNTWALNTNLKLGS